MVLVHHVALLVKLTDVFETKRLNYVPKS